MAAAPDGSALYIASRARGCVDIFDPATNMLRRQAHSDGDLLDRRRSVTPESQFLFVATEQGDTVKTIDPDRRVNGATNPNYWIR